ncbi:MAG: type II toxin-antitoxin system RelE/ParE family toxin [Alphaproteobacteria bacterium]|nr:type II toxin-antitoxin system RelE/ParE family toxin [Alphaproteobacteria bacterium]
MAEYRLSRKTQCDLDDIFEYTVEHWSLAQALRHTDLIETACACLAAAPQRAKDCSAIRSGYRRSIVGEHFIYFRPATYGIAIIRILHQRMDQVRHLRSRTRGN